jgi:ribosomal protein S18 acetylase RimI-like enzyme
MHEGMETAATRVSLRPVEPGDAALNFRIYADSRAYELSFTGWNAEQAEVFLQHQFTAQNNHYWHYYPNSALELILFQGEPAGRLWVNRSPDEIRILDIAVLIATRRQGIGTSIIEKLQTEATPTRTPVLVHVEVNNPSLGLFQRLGFGIKEEKGPHLLMQWEPQAD